MEAVITVIGRDAVGILGKVCTACAEANANVEEVTQRSWKCTFAMIMLVDLRRSVLDVTCFAEKNAALGQEMGVDIRCPRQELYEAMSRG